MKHVLCLAVVAFISTPATANVLMLNSGWQYDEIAAIDTPSNSSPWTLTLAKGAHFSLTDSFNTGDIFTITGDINGVTSLFSGPNDIRATGDPSAVFGWLNPNFGKFTTYLGAGTYTFTISGNGGGGIPAGLFIRADSAIPEPASWALLITGFGLIGAAIRKRKDALPA